MSEPPSCQPLSFFPTDRGSSRRLKKKKRAEDERLKDETLEKLKELGNSVRALRAVTPKHSTTRQVLGNFGMSLDNFKMEKQPDGGFSVSRDASADSYFFVGGGCRPNLASKP